MRLIDKNAIIKMLNTMDRYTSEELTLCDTDKTFPKNEVFIVDDVYEGLDELPTIEPERKTGQWLPDNNNYYEERYICSACKRSYKVDTCMGKPIWNYCPCGAKMEEGEK